MISLEQINQELEQGSVLPARAADLLVVVSAKFGRACDEYIAANAAYAKEFHAQRDNFKSDTATERYLDTTEVGLKKHYWKYQLKKAEMLSKSLNTLVYLKTAEAKNIL